MIARVLAVAGLCLALSSVGFAASRIAIVPLQPGDRASYDFTSTTSTATREDHEDGSFDLVRGKAGAFELNFVPDGALNETFPAILQKDGTLDLATTSEVDQPPFVLQRFNQVATIVASAPPVFKAGDTWKTKINVPLPYSQSVDVPVSVHVTAATDTDFDLDATGQIATRLLSTPPTPSQGGVTAPVGGSTTISSDAGLPLTLNLHMTAHVLAGKLAKADGTLHSTVQAPRDLVEITSRWALVVHKAPPT
jgi:hypothetical protein